MHTDEKMHMEKVMKRMIEKVNEGERLASIIVMEIANEMKISPADPKAALWRLLDRKVLRMTINRTLVPWEKM